MTLCRLLDDYIAHDLTTDESARFAAHLPLCPACQQAVCAEQRLDSLLAEAVTRLEPVPPRLSERVGSRLHSARRRRLAAAMALVAASVVVCVLAGRFLTRFEATAPAPEVKVHRQPPAPALTPAAAHVRVKFRDTSGVLAVPVPSESPNVTFIWIYTGLREPGSAGQGRESELPIPERSNQ